MPPDADEMTTGPNARGCVIEGLRVAAVQVGSALADAVANTALAEAYLRSAQLRQCDLVVFPECFLNGYSVMPAVSAVAEPPDGEAIRILRALAARYHLAVVAGFIERNPDDPSRPFNSAAVIGRDGELVGVYRKTHLYGRESDVFRAGDTYPVFALPLGGPTRPVPVGVAICADLEYPEVIRIMALQGAQLVAVPSADMEPFRLQQAANLRSRAIENNLHVVLANSIGEREGFRFFGGSGVAAPDGRVVSAGYDRTRMITATLRCAAVAASGGVGMYLRTRRPETYGVLTATGERGRGFGEKQVRS